MASTISVYYKYDNDVDILLGTKEKPPHDGVYKQTDYYTMYNDGYLVQTGSTPAISTRGQTEITINFKVPFIDTNYSISFSSDFEISVNSSSKYTDHYRAIVSVFTTVTGHISAKYTATGYWK